MKKKQIFNVRINADASAVKADDIMPAVEEGKALAVKTFVKKNDNDVYRVYVDNAGDPQCDIGKLEEIPEGLDLDRALSLYEVELTITGTDGDEELSGTITVTIPEKVVESKPTDIPDSMMKFIDRKMAEGIDESVKPAVLSRVRYMYNNYVNEADIEDVVRYWDPKLINEWGNRVPTYYVDPDLEEKHKVGKNGVITKAIHAYLNGMPKTLEGPKSTGKNTCINSVVWLFGDKSEEHTFTQQDAMADLMASESTDNSACEQMRTIRTDVLAQATKIRLEHANNPEKAFTKEEDEILLAESLFRQLSAQAASVQIIHEYRAFARWILDETGHTCFIANEMNMADANLLVGLLHSILDGSITEYDIPGKGLVPIAKHHMMFATMNVGYAGEMEANAATKSRFGSIKLGQPKNILKVLKSAVSSELKKLGVEGDLEDKYYNAAEKFYSQCRKSVEKGDLSDQCLNVRGIVRALTTTKRFEGRTTLNQELEDEVVTPCGDEESGVLTVLLDATVNC